MYARLAFRHLLVRPGRALVLLVGYALGVAVMIVLLSVGDAMLDQSRDVALVGGGELTVLPQGVDVEALRSGGLAGMFFGINAAPFVAREILGGARHASAVASISPVIELKLATVRTADTSFAVRAGGELPAAALRAGSGLHVIAGSWSSNASDRRWIAPDAQQLYDEIDRFHRPAQGDSTWAEWQYFNVVVTAREWWYITLLVAGDPSSTHFGGQLLVTHRLPGGAYHRFVTSIPRDRVVTDTLRADLTVGPGTVTQRDGTYHVRGHSGRATFDLVITPSPHRYFPPIELGAGSSPSGYAVPALSGSASGRLCDGASCVVVRGAQAYHDHNWGSWHAVTWEWGAGQGGSHAVLYGGVLPEDRRPGSVPFFFALEDSLGFQQVYRFEEVRRMGGRAIPGFPGISAPESLHIDAVRLTDTLRLDVVILDVAASTSLAAGPDRVFLQMRGHWQARGRAAGETISDSGSGFFETWMRSTFQRSPHPTRAHVRDY